MDQSHVEPNYMKNFLWLAGLRSVEVGVVYTHIPHVCMVIALIFWRFSKRFLSRWNFMHLRFEKPPSSPW